ncbi:ABC transporter permease [Desulfosporosinus shakirovi]|uniref:ABC transporter permease n=1 Tax=Desulfosporosinus shakirovi TaxID=2885154 RepID=UPI001E39E6D2|nr:FtsX-like permease family protein [Desulfosporosinus sp. SRJS8]MCB8818235.1 FtsX-like permease family protein [Desulfosporosinus sp. SRJS8]
MGKKALNRDILKEFTKSRTRFMSIMLMIALGSFIFVGMYVTGPTMRNTLLTYADKYHLEDLTVTSPLGLAMEDELILDSVSGIELLDYSYRTDLMQRDSDVIVRAESMGRLPGYEILEGRLPMGAEELALDGMMREKGYKIGDPLLFIPEKVQNSYPLKNYDFIIVGFVNSPEYLMPLEKGTSSIGDGVVDCFAVIANENFALENVSLARLDFSDVKGLDTYSDEYKEKMKTHSDEVEQAFASRPEIKLEQYRKEGTAEISQAQSEITDAEQQMLDAKLTLDDARAQLENGWADYEDGKATFETKIREGQAKITSGQEELLASKAQLDDGYAEFANGKKKLADSQAEFADSQAKLADAKLQLEDGQAQLDAAQKTIDDGRVELAAKTTELNDGLAELNGGLSQISASLTEIDAGLAQIAIGLPQIAAGLQQAEASMAALDDGIAQIDRQLPGIDQSLASLNASLATIEKSLTSIDAQLDNLNSNIADLTSQRSALSARQDELKALLAHTPEPNPLAQAELDAIPGKIAAIDAELASLEQQTSDLTPKKADLANQQTALNAQKAPLLQTKAGLEQSRADLVAQKPQLEGTKASLLAQQTDLLNKQDQTVNKKAELQAQYNALLAQQKAALESLALLSDAKNKLNDSQQTLDKQQAEFNAKKADYEDGLIQLEEGRVKLADGQAELEKARGELADGQAKYDDGAAQLEDARATLATEGAKVEEELKAAYRKLLDGGADYEQGRLEYINKLPKAQKEIEQGKTELNKAKNQLARLKVPDYTIHDRYKNMGFYQIIQNSESMDLLSLFFPVFFFLIALLVSLTTMTRMVDEQRLQIGTMKALGYSDWDVIKKFLAYGSLASLIGSLIGIAGGQNILMPIIFDAYSSSFIFNQELPLLSPVFSVIAVLISLLCTGFVAFLTTRASLTNNVSVLLRPKAPKIGNRILLERFTPLWRRLSFNYKVTARNIFRYKNRMLMTIIGVAGCTALIFMGFGIRDSVGSLFFKQYSDLFRYDTVVIFDENAATEDLLAFSDGLKSDSRIAGLYPARFEQGIVQIPGKLDQTVAVVVPEDEAAFRTINQLRERRSKLPIPLADGAVITEKIAVLLGLNVGDKLEFKDNDGTFKTIEIAGITENYAGHYLYLPLGYYEELFGKPYRVNSDYLLLQDNSTESVSLFSRSMLEKEVVLSTVNTNVAGDAIGNLTDSLNIVVLVLVLVSSLLAVVVLYNLTNINVSERIRELSTIMVLGFYPSEVTGYVYRETMILTTIGIFIGFVFGLLLHGFIVTTLPPENVLMDPAVKLTSYILAAGFTLAFSLVVMLIMHRRLKGINMVEALKAVE